MIGSVISHLRTSRPWYCPVGKRPISNRVHTRIHPASSSSTPGSWTTKAMFRPCFRFHDRKFSVVTIVERSVVSSFAQTATVAILLLAGKLRRYVLGAALRFAAPFTRPAAAALSRPFAGVVPPGSWAVVRRLFSRLVHGARRCQLSRMTSLDSEASFPPIHSLGSPSGAL